MADRLSLPFSGTKLQTTREKAGFSRPGLVRQLKNNGYSVTSQQLGRIEVGASKPSAPLLKALADALDIDVDDLLEPALVEQAS